MTHEHALPTLHDPVCVVRKKWTSRMQSVSTAAGDDDGPFECDCVEDNKLGCLIDVRRHGSDGPCRLPKDQPDGIGSLNLERLLLPETAPAAAPFPRAAAGGDAFPRDCAVFRPRPRLNSAPAKIVEEAVAQSNKSSSLLQRRRLLSGLTVNVDRESPREKVNSEETLQFLEDRYELFEKLGTGSTCVVRRAVRRSDGAEVALKVCRRGDSALKSFARREYELLRQFRQPNILQVYDFHDTACFDVLVLAHFSSGTLEDAVKASPSDRLPEESSQHLGLLLFRALAHVHQHGVIHRDVKPQNVLVSGDLQDLCLADFNVAHRLDDGVPLTPTGTPLYCAPEVIGGQPPSAPSDVWSGGLCIYLSVSGRLPQRRQDGLYASTLQEIASAPAQFGGRIWRRVSPLCKATLQSCLRVERTGRPSAADLIAKSWFTAGGQSSCA